MATNGWLPRTGVEWFRWQEQRMRIQERRSLTVFTAEDPNAVDASTGVDTIPEDTIIDDGNLASQPYDYAMFTPEDIAPSAGSEPPGGLETSP